MHFQLHCSSPVYFRNVSIHSMTLSAFLSGIDESDELVFDLNSTRLHCLRSQGGRKQCEFGLWGNQQFHMINFAQFAPIRPNVQFPSHLYLPKGLIYSAQENKSQKSLHFGYSITKFILWIHGCLLMFSAGSTMLLILSKIMILWHYLWYYVNNQIF